jgi:hypothetical protein
LLELLLRPEEELRFAFLLLSGSAFFFSGSRRNFGMNFSFFVLQLPEEKGDSATIA